MLFLDFADHFIPGYKTLSEKQQKIFEASKPGQHLVKLIKNAISELENFKQSQGWLSFLFGNNEKKHQQMRDKFAQDKKILHNSIKKSPEYQTVTMQITSYYLKIEYEDFNLLNDEAQKKLAATDFSHTMGFTLTELDQSLEKETFEYNNLDEWAKMHRGYQWLERIDELKIQRENAIVAWKKAFLAENGELEQFRKTISSQKQLIRKEQIAQEHRLLEEHLNQLAKFFPLVYYRKSREDLTTLNRLKTKYFSNNDINSSKTAELDIEQLSNLLFYLMQEANKVEMDFINLDTFNEQQAHLLAQKILKAFNEKTDLQLECWINEYSNHLYRYFISNIDLVNGKKWQIKKTDTAQGLINSLSYLWNNPAVEKINAYMGKLADAHAFIQATHFSTQNESSVMAILDVYNYNRYSNQIVETKSIIFNLLQPLQSLYDEYKHIALYEKNMYMKTIRILMPILMVVGLVILASVALAPLALPELAFIAAFVPTLILGLVLAAKYVSVKNDVYKYFRDKYYGGSFEIPEFQINTRMDEAFGHNLAVKVRQHYIDGIKQCDEVELKYRTLHLQGTLSQEAIKQRKENLIKRHQLYLEWYDIHSNYDLGVDELKAIVLSRLQTECDLEYQSLETALVKEKKTIAELLTQVTGDLKTTIINNNVIPKVEEQNDAEKTLIRTSYRHGLFKLPRTLSIKNHLEEMATLSSQLMAEAKLGATA